MSGRQRTFKEEHPLGQCLPMMRIFAGWAKAKCLKRDLVVTQFLSAEKRQAEAQRIRDKYPDRIPVSVAHCANMVSQTGTPAHGRHHAGDCGEG